MPANIIYVDQNARNLGAGTFFRPFATIAEALATGELLSYDTLLINVRSGVYQEVCDLRTWVGPPTISIVGSDKSEVRVRGSVRYTGWTRTSYPNVWVHEWTLDTQPAVPAYDPDDPTIKEWLYGNDPSNTERATVLTYFNLVTADGEPLEQKIALTDSEGNLELTAGSMYADEGNDLLYVWLVGNANPNERQTWVSEKYYGVAAEGNTSTLTSLSLTGITVEGFASNVDITRLTSLECLNVVSRNAAKKGFNLARTPLTFDNVSSVNNGFDGMAVNFTVGAEMDNVTCAYNNTRGAWVGAASWQVSGFGKFYGCRDVTISNSRSVRNKTTGMWFDRLCSEVTLNNVEISNNSCGGLFWEISGQDTSDFGLRLYNSRITGNATDNTLDGVRFGLCMDCARNVDVQNTVIKDNAPEDWHVKGAVVGRTAVGWEGAEVGVPVTMINGQHSIDRVAFTNDGGPESIAFANYYTDAVKKYYFQNELSITPEPLRVLLTPPEYLKYS